MNLKPKLKLVKGTKFISFLFIGSSALIAAGVLFGANMYFNIDTNEVVTEHIQRITGTVRATTNMIIGGTATQDPESGVSLQIVDGDVLLSGNNALRFYSGEYYTGFMATTTMTGDAVYYLPIGAPDSPDYVLTWQSGNQLEWKEASEIALIADITAVGDVEQGRAFASDGEGTSLWFHDGEETGLLTIGTLTGSQTYTLPDLTGTITLADGGLGSGGVLFADEGLIATSTNLSWDNTDLIFQIGSTNNAGELRIYSSHASGHYLGFAATSSMTQNTVYNWPINYGTDNYVLTSDGNGNLRWENVEGVGGISGTGVDGQMAYWTSETTLGGLTNFTWDSEESLFTMDGDLDLSGTLFANLIQYTGGDLTFETLESGDIILTSAGEIVLSSEEGVVRLGDGTVILTDGGGPASRQPGEEVLREMIPILGFDLPVQTATSTAYIKVSRTLENYPFAEAATGTDRIHKLVFRYGTDATSSISVQVATSGGAYDPFALVPSTNNDLNDGNAHIEEVTIPDSAWWVQVQTANEPDTIRIYQVFLAAYDVIN